jgi:putative transposase
MTKLSVWWIRLGIKIERIKPGNPQQNGRHERMHRTLKLAVTEPPGLNQLQQQEKFFEFTNEYNNERPHQGLDMKCPADVYKKSTRQYQGLSDITYPSCDKTLLISNCGRICIKKMKVHISKAFANQPIGLQEADDHIWSVHFMDYHLGYFDEYSMKFAPKEDPFGIKLDKAI